MSSFLYHILTYLLIIIISLIGYWIISLVLKFFFRGENEESKSLSYPVIKGLSILISAFLIHNKYHQELINASINVLNAIFQFRIETITETSLGGSIEAIIFYVIVGVIVVFYVVYAYSRKEIRLIEKKAALLQEKITIKINFPTDPVPPSPIFFERIKYLVELKFEKQNLKLDYDKEYSALYGIYDYGLHKYCAIIYCQESIHKIKITTNEIHR